MGLIPDLPGTKKIPPGMVRRFHVTQKENLESILMNGLESHQCIEGPKGVYSWSKWEDAVRYAGGFNALFNNASMIVEFFDNPENYKWHTQINAGSIPSSQIIDMHLPWHELAREGNEFLEDVKDIDRKLLSPNEITAYEYLMGKSENL